MLAGKFSKFTPRRLSPVVTGIGDGPGGGNGPGAGNACPGDDYDNDLLSNSLELSSQRSIRASLTPTGTRSRTATSTSPRST